MKFFLFVVWLSQLASMAHAHTSPKEKPFEKGDVVFLEANGEGPFTVEDVGETIITIKRAAPTKGPDGGVDEFVLFARDQLSNRLEVKSLDGLELQQNVYYKSTPAGLPIGEGQIFGFFSKDRVLIRSIETGVFVRVRRAAILKPADAVYGLKVGRMVFFDVDGETVSAWLKAIFVDFVQAEIGTEKRWYPTSSIAEFCRDIT
jgi:hypothetical protein